MEKEFSAALHPTQYGNHIKDGRHRVTKINPEVRKLMDAGMSQRSAYRHAKAVKPKKKEPEFDYDKETPKGEWV
jgi:uncharacterized protein YqgQ